MRKYHFITQKRSKKQRLWSSFAAWKKNDCHRQQSSGSRRQGRIPLSTLQRLDFTFSLPLPSDLSEKDEGDQVFSFFNQSMATVLNGLLHPLPGCDATSGFYLLPCKCSLLHFSQTQLFFAVLWWSLLVFVGLRVIGRASLFLLEWTAIADSQWCLQADWATTVDFCDLNGWYPDSADRFTSKKYF